jgi:hypothetical protein
LGSSVACFPCWTISIWVILLLFFQHLSIQSELNCWWQLRCQEALLLTIRWAVNSGSKGNFTGRAFSLLNSATFLGSFHKQILGYG